MRKLRSKLALPVAVGLGLALTACQGQNKAADDGANAMQDAESTQLTAEQKVEVQSIEETIGDIESDSRKAEDVKSVEKVVQDLENIGDNSSEG